MDLSLSLSILTPRSSLGHTCCVLPNLVSSKDPTKHSPMPPPDSVLVAHPMLWSSLVGSETPASPHHIQPTGLVGNHKFVYQSSLVNICKLACLQHPQPSGPASATQPTCRPSLVSGQEPSPPMPPHTHRHSSGGKAFIIAQTGPTICLIPVLSCLPLSWNHPCASNANQHQVSEVLTSLSIILAPHP